jgi:hypothetical protein
VRLCPERDFRREQEQPALADRGIDDLHAAAQIALPVGPSAPEGRRAVEPRYRAHALERRLRTKAEDRAVVEEHVDVILETVGDRGGVVHCHPQNGPGHVILLRRQRPRASFRGAFGEMVLHRQAEQLREAAARPTRR